MKSLRIRNNKNKFYIMHIFIKIVCDSPPSKITHHIENKLRMVSTRSEKTYNYYLNNYRKWCRKNDVCENESLTDYKNFFILNKKSQSYIKNSLNTISKVMQLPIVEKKIEKKDKMTEKELSLLKKVCKHSYQRDEISLILLLILESDLKLTQILKLNTADIDCVISHKKLLNGTLIPINAMYIFEYLLSISLQKSTSDKFFTKTYHSYLYSFKRRQKELFPLNPSNKSFNCIKN